MVKRYIEAAIGASFAYVGYSLFGWIGLVVCVVFLILLFAGEVVRNQQMIINTLNSRLPDRCVFCHREIVDEGGLIDVEGTYHEACAEKLESLEELRKEAGVPLSEAIHRPRPR